MRSRLSILGLVLILGGLILNGCGLGTELPPEGPTATPTAATVEGPDPVRARDAALVYVIGHYGEQGPQGDLLWTEERTTPEGLVGSETFQYAADDWVVNISNPIVAPEATIYEVTVTNADLGLDWQGTVDAQGTVTEA